MVKPRILVMGATGKTGGAVVDVLLEQGYPVRAAIRTRDARSEHLESKGVETVIADFFDPEQLLVAMKDVSRAYFVPIFHPFMIQGAAAFAWAAREARLEHVVQMSQWLSSPAHPSLQTRQTWLVDQMFASLPQMAHTIVNPGMFADNFLRLMDFAALLGVYPHVTGNSRSAPVSNEDIARVVAAVIADPARHAGKRYRPTGPTLLSAKEIARTMGKVVDSPVLPVRIPFWMFVRSARLQGVDPFEISGYRFYMEEHRRGAFEFDGGVNDVVRDLTGTPAEPFETTVARYAGMPFARRTLANRVRAFLQFNRVPFQRGWNLDKFDRDHLFPIPPAAAYSSNNETWKSERRGSAAVRPALVRQGSAA